MLPIKITIYGTKGQCLCQSLFAAHWNAVDANDAQPLAFVPIAAIVAVSAKRLPQAARVPFLQI
jgi:hypothetical protein